MDNFTRNTLFTLLAIVAIAGFFLSRALTTTNQPETPNPAAINPTNPTPEPGTLTIELNKLERPSHAIFVKATITLTNATDKPIFYNQYALHAFVYQPGTQNQIDSAAAIDVRMMEASDVKVILPAESHKLETSSWIIPQTLKTADVVVRLDTWMKIDTRLISHELRQKYPDAILLSTPAATPPTPLP